LTENVFRTFSCKCTQDYPWGYSVSTSSAICS